MPESAILQYKINDMAVYKQIMTKLPTSYPQIMDNFM